MAIKIHEPFLPVTEVEHSAFCHTDLKAKPLEAELQAGVRWQRIPTQYLRLDGDELDARIGVARRKLGARVVILGHHYQREEIIRYADFRGDSFLLSQQAASRPDADTIIFCGVHFMAETARVLCAPHQRVILPNLTAGCSMADMARTDDVLDCWDDLMSVVGEGGIVPITYMNSTAAIKAHCGRNDGIVCTSSNAGATFKWAYARSPRVLFLPDQHLGRNSGLKYGIKLDEMALWNPFKPMGGNTPEALMKARLVLWQGHCSVHTRFTVKQVEQARQRYPDIKVLVHPECTMEVVHSADLVGSTEFIARTIRSAPAGSRWVVGTEISLVNRLAKENPDKLVFCLDSVICPCSTMYRIHPAYLLWVLDNLLEGQVVNEITVEEETARYAKIALERMLQVV
ncbi:MAG: quinolinate synthase NadA [Chloroflexota bacterium]|nr:quinolinate synthase NadA [Chloroflexota bacterium]